MEVTELMVGDWVQHLNKYFKVFMVMGSKIYLEDSNRETTVQHIRSLQPIPITPDILEKNDFNKVDEYGCYNYKDTFAVYIYPHDVRFVHSKEGAFVNIGINSVHELQHALRLCKIDKEIKL